MPKPGAKGHETIKAFNKLWHESVDGTWHKMRWLGVKALKTPTDFWVYQELITGIRPDWIIETGTCFGGSALFMASVLDGLGKGKILTIDIKKPRRPPAHPRIEYYTGSSVDPKTLAYVRRRISGKVLVILDSDHSMGHVFKELEAYSWMVSPGSYLIVEDTSLNGDVRKDHGPGPREALEKWLPTQDRFAVDEGCERYYLTFHPGGYLRCVR